MRFKDRVVFVTGASSGIGKAAAKLFASEGAKVGCLGHKANEVEDVVAEICAEGGEAAALVADVTSPEQMQAAVEKLIATWGKLDIAFANAGINGVWAPIDEIDPTEWEQTIATNLRGTFLTFHYCVPHMKERGGSILVTSSGQGTRSFSVPGSTAYACTKAAQVVMVKKMALELARYNIRVNVICPGSTDTNINDTKVARSIEKIKLPVEFPQGKVLLTRGKKASPEQVARLALFLASDEADMITGTEVWIDGGMSLIQG